MVCYTYLLDESMKVKNILMISKQQTETGHHCYKYPRSAKELLSTQEMRQKIYSNIVTPIGIVSNDSDSYVFSSYVSMYCTNVTHSTGHTQVLRRSGATLFIVDSC